MRLVHCATILLTLAGDDQIAVLDLKTLQVTGHLTTGKGPDGMAWAVRQ
jgi:hypothetical protein